MAFIDINDATVHSNSIEFDIDNLGIYAIRQKIDTTHYIYNEGNQCTSLTGGWKTNIRQVNGWGKTSAVFNDKSVYMTCDRQDNTICCIATNNKINFNGYTKVKIEYEQIHIESGNSPTVSIAPTNTDGFEYTEIGRFTNLNQSSIVEFNIGNISGEYYFIFYVHRTTYATVKRIWLE